MTILSDAWTDVIVNGAMAGKFANSVINHVFRSASGTSGSCYVALYTACCTGSGLERDTDLYEPLPIYNYYQRAASGIWTIYANSASVGGCAVNGSAIKFEATTGSFGSIYNWGLRTGSWSGNSGSLMFYGPIGTNLETFTRYMGMGDSLTFPLSSMRIKMGTLFSSVLSGSLLNHYFNSIRLSSSDVNLWIGLYTIAKVKGETVLIDGESVPINAPLISGSLELSVPGYTRLKIGPSASSWAIPGVESGSSFTHNTEHIIFSTNTEGEWGWIYGAFINSAVTGGDRLLIIPLEVPVFVSSSAGFMFSASNLKIKVA